MEEWNLISDDQNTSGKYFRFDVSLLQIIAVCDDIYIFVVVVVVREKGLLKEGIFCPSAVLNRWIRIRHGDADQ